MSTVNIILCLMAALVSVHAKMDCSFLGSKHIEDKLFHSCPNPLQAVTNPEKAYCCPTGDTWECCDLATFISTPPIDSLILTGLVILFIFVCCFLSCCVFCCCAVSRRRQRGRVLQNQGIRLY